MSAISINPPEVVHDDTYTLGLPVYVALVISAPPATTLKGLPNADLYTIDECIGVELRQPGAQRPVIKYVPTPVLDPDLTGSPGFSLEPDERHRMLVDISPFLASGLAPARYELKLAYVDADGQHWSAPVTVTFADADEATRQRIARRAPTRADFPTWNLWLFAQPDRLRYQDDPTDPDPLRLILLLRALLHDPAGRAAVPIPDPDTFTPLLRPEVTALAAESARANADNAAATRLEAQLRADHPDLAWWLDRITQGGTVVPRPGG